MGTTAAGIVFAASLVVALAAVHVPLGDYMYRVYASTRDSRAEGLIYRIIGADPRAEQTWGAYARSVLAFSAVSILFLFGLQLLQGKLPLHLDGPATEMTPALAWNTAVSFVTNTNWQAYSGESTQGHLVQVAGLTVQNFVSSAVGMAVAIAFVRGLSRRSTGELGNFWVDLVRGVIRILLPLSVIAAAILISGGVIQNFALHDQVVGTLAGAQQTIPGGPVASQEAIKELGTNGGGFFNANSAHPFENPTTWTNWVELFLLAMIAFSLPRTFGRMVESRRQGLAIVAVMASIATLSVSLTMLFQLQHHGTVPTAVGASMEGVEQRFGVANSAVFAAATTLTSTGAVDSMHDSYTSLGGLMLLFNMQLGEVAPGGGLGALRHVDPGDHHRLRRRPDGGTHPGVSGQEDHPTRDQAGGQHIPHHAADRADGHRGGDRDAGATCRHAQHRPARVVGSALRVHLGRQQQRLGVRRNRGEHHVVQHRPGVGDDVR